VKKLCVSSVGREKKKKPAPPPIIPKSLPHIEREIIITCNLDIIPAAERKAFLDSALIRFNSTIVRSAKIDLPPFIFARTTSNNKLLLTTNHTTPVAAYKPYRQLFTNQMTLFTPTAAEINTHWSKFLVHNIPTNASPSVIKEQIELIYPALHLAQIPCANTPLACPNRSPCQQTSIHTCHLSPRCDRPQTPWHNYTHPLQPKMPHRTILLVDSRLPLP
jgi:hypothetical protein